MRKLVAAVALALGLATALPAQQWGTWTPGRGAFGDWHWASPVASLVALQAITGTAGKCANITGGDEAGQIWCWNGVTEQWQPSGGGADDQTAAEVPYDPTASGLTATDVQAAVDELAAAPTGDVTGPSSSTVHGFALFADTTGKLLTSSTWTLDADVLLAPNVGAIKIGSSGLRLRNGEIDRISGPLDIHTNGADALNIYAGGDLAIGGALENIYLGGGPAQPVIGTGLFDFTASKLRLPNGNTAALPATCSLGQQYVNTQTALHCDCTATNTWTCGKAATAATLEANGTNCGAGNYPLGVDASGNAEGCTAAAGGSGDVIGPSSATDNAVARFDSTTGKLIQNSDLTIADVSGASVTVASTAGNALAVTATAPTQTTGAQAGKSAALTASPAMAGSSTAGAAAGGSVTITGGAAARLTSGNANGGNINLVPGLGIGSGTRGVVFIGDVVGDSNHVSLYQPGGSAVLELRDGTGAAGAYGNWRANSYVLQNGGSSINRFTTEGVELGSAKTTAWASGGDPAGPKDTTIGRAGAASSLGQDGGNFTAAGDARAVSRVLRNSTTNATPTELFLNGSSARMALANDTAWAFECMVVARRTDADGEGAGYTLVGVVDRQTNAASTALIGTVTTTVLAEDSATWDVAATADTTNGALILTVTGEAGKAVRWVATCMTVETTG